MCFFLFFQTSTTVKEGEKDPVTSEKAQTSESPTKASDDSKTKESPAISQSSPKEKSEKEKQEEESTEKEASPEKTSDSPSVKDESRGNCGSKWWNLIGCSASQSFYCDLWLIVVCHYRGFKRGQGREKRKGWRRKREKWTDVSSHRNNRKEREIRSTLRYQKRWTLKCYSFFLRILYIIYSCIVKNEKLLDQSCL